MARLGQICQECRKIASEGLNPYRMGNCTPCGKYHRYGSKLGQKCHQKETMSIRAGHIRCDACFRCSSSHEDEGEADHGGVAARLLGDETGQCQSYQ